MHAPKMIPAGERYGRLTVTVQRNPGEDRVQCRCDCGNDHTILFKEWGRTKSCGCYRRDYGKTHNATHRMSKTPEYRVWHHMISRCLNPTDGDYAAYGGRGIEVCDRWRRFENFYADMGPRPSLEHSIDRVDNDGPYTPSNCRWATAKEQANNRRARSLLTHCRRGHELTEDNLYRTGNRRQCRACVLAGVRRRRAGREASV